MIWRDIVYIVLESRKRVSIKKDVQHRLFGPNLIFEETI